MLGDGITNTECEDVGVDLHGSGTMTSNKEILGKRYWRPESEVLEQHRGSERTSRTPCNPSHGRCGFHVPRATAGMNPSKLRREINRAALLGALIGGHQQLHYLEAVVECQRRLLARKKRTDEVAVLGLVAVGRRLIRDHRHLAHLGVLLLHQVLTQLPLDLAAKEELEAALERVPRHRVLRAEQFGREAEARPHEAP